MSLISDFAPRPTKGVYYIQATHQNSPLVDLLLISAIKSCSRTLHSSGRHVDHFIKLTVYQQTVAEVCVTDLNTSNLKVGFRFL